MALIITQGPLPQDGSPIDPAADLENWISGTTIDNIPLGSFESTISFTFSSTDAPASAERFLGMLWFKRGEGRLYIWGIPDSPSALSYTDADWLSISDRKDLFVKLDSDVLAGDPLYFTGTDEFTASLASTAAILNTASVITAVKNSIQASNAMSDHIFVALEAGDSGALIRAGDVGFMSFRMAGGESGVVGPLYVQDTVSLSNRVYNLGAYTQTTDPGRMMVAIVTTEQAASGSPWLATAYKMPNSPIATSQYHT